MTNYAKSIHKSNETDTQSIHKSIRHKGDLIIPSKAKPLQDKDTKEGSSEIKSKKTKAAEGEVEKVDLWGEPSIVGSDARRRRCRRLESRGTPHQLLELRDDNLNDFHTAITRIL